MLDWLEIDLIGVGRVRDELEGAEDVEELEELLGEVDSAKEEVIDKCSDFIFDLEDLADDIESQIEKECD